MQKGFKMNSVVLIGRLARDPELSYTPQTQTAVTKFTLAVDRPKRQGEDQGADFIRVTVFGKQAESCDKYLAKGRQAGVHGRIETGSFVNREGVTVYTTDVIADRVEFLGGGNKGSGQLEQGYPSQGGGQAPQQQVPQQGAQNQIDMSSFDDLPDTFQAAEDDIPF